MDLPQGAKAQQIAEAARQVFMAEGYGAASMEAIAREAAVSKATLYAYYPGKEALFAAIIGFECQRRGQALQAPEDEREDVRNALLRFGRSLAELTLAPRTLAIYRVVVAEAARFPELGRVFYDSGPNRMLTRLAGYFEEATAGGRLRVPDPRLAAEQFTGMIRGIAYLRHLLGIDDEAAERDLDAVVESAVEVFLRAYGPDRAGSPTK